MAGEGSGDPVFSTQAPSTIGEFFDSWSLFFSVFSLYVLEISTDPDKAKFSIPSWAIKPPSGVHLDVMKNDQLIQVLVCLFNWLSYKNV